MADLLEQANQASSDPVKKGASRGSQPATPDPSAQEPSKPVPSDASPQTTADAEMAATATEPFSAKVPIPETELLTNATDQVRDLLQDDYLLADNAEKRTALARQLLTLGEETANRPVVRYACYSLALEQAARVGDPQLIDQVVQRLAQDYSVDALHLRAETMATAWRSEYSIPHRVDLFKQSQALLTEALKAKNYDAANQAIRVVMAGARAAKDYRLLRELEEQREKIRAAEKTPGH